MPSPPFAVTNTRCAHAASPTAAVFGSVARGDNRPDSDLDILIEFEPGAEGSVYDYVRFKEYVAGLFEGPVDVIDRAAFKPHLKAPSARDAFYAF